MHSMLISSKDKNKTMDYIQTFCRKNKIDTFDISRNLFEKAIGIADVRNIHKQLILRPFKGKVKAVIIEAYDNITTEAQNALLKVLEEPPANTIIIIATSKKELILPTIISRCKIIELSDNKETLSTEEITQLHNYLISLSEKGISYKLKLAQDIARSEGAVAWLEKMAIFARQKLVENYNNPKYLKFLKSLQETYTVVKSTNVNHRIALENLFLSF